jgi:hypothetical protein
VAAFPRLRLRDPAIDLVDLPWELPLAPAPERLGKDDDPTVLLDPPDGEAFEIDALEFDDGDEDSASGARMAPSST